MLDPVSYYDRRLGTWPIVWISASQISQKAGDQIQQALPSLHTQGLISFLRAGKDTRPQNYVTARSQQ